MGEVQNKVSEEFQQRLVVQNKRIDKLSESVMKSQKSAQDNAELMQTLLVGMENLGENFKQFRENMDYWQTPEIQIPKAEHQLLNEELLKEVSPSVPAMSGPIGVDTKPSYILSPSICTAVLNP